MNTIIVIIKWKIYLYLTELLPKYFCKLQISADLTGKKIYKKTFKLGTVHTKLFFKIETLDEASSQLIQYFQKMFKEKRILQGDFWELTFFF